MYAIMSPAQNNVTHVDCVLFEIYALEHAVNLASIVKKAID